MNLNNTTGRKNLFDTDCSFLSLVKISTLLKTKITILKLNLRNYLIKKLVGTSPVLMNLTVTSDILQYNKIPSSNSFTHNLKVRSVSSRQSFVYSPSNTTYVN